MFNVISVITYTDTFNIVPGRGSTSMIVSSQPFDYESTDTHHLYVTAHMGFQVDGGCENSGGYIYHDLCHFRTSVATVSLW